MGYPLTAIAIGVTVWAVRKADKRLAQLASEEPDAEQHPARPAPEGA
jgi:hypothetical protein